MKYTIRKGANVRQDFSWIEWGSDQTEFIASDDIRNGRQKCLADGYGSFIDGEKYGNGCLYVKSSDLIPVKKREHPDPHELWAAAQLMPGEGIEDGVRRIRELLEVKK